jgi:hypothetical protein
LTSSQAGRFVPGCTCVASSDCWAAFFGLSGVHAVGLRVLAVGLLRSAVWAAQLNPFLVLWC